MPEKDFRGFETLSRAHKGDEYSVALGAALGA